MAALEFLAWGLWAWLALYCLRTGQLWQRIRSHSSVQHLTLGFTVGLFLLWQLRAGIYDGLDLHFVALTVTTLVFGWRNAIVVASLVQLAIMAVGIEPWHSGGIMALLGIAAPILLSFAILTLSHNYLPRNLWIYIFIDGFLAGIACFVVRTLLLSLWFSGQYDWYIVQDNYLVLMPLFFFPEAMLNGFTTTLLVVHRPHWLATWQDTPDSL
ncbi:energy-coupling factor ABC transporter permease [Ferrimonas aestuarii]|uniref:Uncharacterized protein n=1 Tax=Ferrimonas aestuarii TaxID=2569539 RepID=A0A4U1BT99_9GAMM|nr:energy-coupling factor ABC transporter permease [Ferrimonas aestuarii]TKB58389.1 hypothetical protein FCL42_01175 [Ferrimonas aestuarii]